MSLYCRTRTLAPWKVQIKRIFYLNSAPGRREKEVAGVRTNARTMQPFCWRGKRYLKINLQENGFKNFALDSELALLDEATLLVS